MSLPKNLCELLEKVLEKTPRIESPRGGPYATGTMYLRYAITNQAQQTMLKHAEANYEIEIGGILLGEVYQEHEKFFVNVTNALPAQNTLSTKAQVTFTSQAWLEIIAQRSSYPDKMTVGWYHSHPGLGVFLSGRDQFTHRSFFGDEPWYIAIVIDPHSGDQGVFVWDDDQIIRCSNDTTHSREKT